MRTLIGLTCIKAITYMGAEIDNIGVFAFLVLLCLLQDVLEIIKGG